MEVPSESTFVSSARCSQPLVGLRGSDPRSTIFIVVHISFVVLFRKLLVVCSWCKVEVRMLENGPFKSSLSIGAPGREFFTWGENQVVKGLQISGVTEERGDSKVENCRYCFCPLQQGAV